MAGKTNLATQLLHTNRHLYAHRHGPVGDIRTPNQIGIDSQWHRHVTMLPGKFLYLKQNISEKCSLLLLLFFGKTCSLNN